MGILFSPSLSLSAGRKRKSVYFNYLAERLQPTTPPTIPISSPLPAHQPVSRPRLFTNQPIEGQQLSITASLPLHWNYWWKSAPFVTTSECWSWRYSPIPKCLEIFIKRKKKMKKKKRFRVSFHPLQICYRKLQRMHDYSARQCSSLSSHQNGAIWCWSAASLSLCCHHIYHHPPRKQTGRTNSPSRCSSTSPQHLTSKLIWATPTDADTKTLSGKLYFNLYPSTGLKLKQTDHEQTVSVTVIK